MKYAATVSFYFNLDFIVEANKEGRLDYRALEDRLEAARREFEDSIRNSLTERTQDELQANNAEKFQCTTDLRDVELVTEVIDEVQIEIDLGEEDPRYMVVGIDRQALHAPRSYGEKPKAYPASGKLYTTLDRAEEEIPELIEANGDKTYWVVEVMTSAVSTQKEG